MGYRILGYCTADHTARKLRLGSQAKCWKKIIEKAQLGVPHSRIQIELGFIL